MIAQSPRTTSFLDSQQPQVIPLVFLFKLFVQQLKWSSSSWHESWFLITLSMYKGKHLYISQEIYIHSINNNHKMRLGFFLLYLRQNIKLYTSNGLGLSWKILQKNNLHELRSIESNFWLMEPCRNWIVISCSYSILTLHINILWANLKQD